jgi:hypothetical protein
VRAHASREQRNEALAAGFSSFVPKPCDFAQILAAL